MVFLFLQICWLSYSRISAQSADCRTLKFMSAMEGHYLQGHVFKIIEVQKESDCDAKCYFDSNCISCNVVSSLVDGTLMCELSDSDHKMHPEALQRRFGSIYHPIENACLSNCCPPQSTCQNGFTDKGYRCIKNTQKSQVDPIQEPQVTQVPHTTQELQATHEPQTSQASVTDNGTQTIQASQTTQRLQTDQVLLTTQGLHITKGSETTREPHATQEPQTSQPPQTTQASKTTYWPQTHQVPLTPQGPPNTQGPDTTQELQNSQAPQITQASQTTHWLYTRQGLQTTTASKTAQIPQTTQVPQTTQEPQSTQKTTVSVTSPVSYPETCSIIKANVSDVSGWYVIDPDGPEGEDPFQVYCNMTDKGGVGVTVVSHDTENRTHVDGCDPAGCYSRDVKYTGVNLSQLEALTDESTYCEQYISYECKASKLLAYGEAWWVSRQGLDMKHWVGTTKTGWCACAEKSTCAKSNVKCNCDVNDKVWREDSGLLGNKLYLPVSQLRFGDTERVPEEGYHTLGKLKCY